MDKRRALAPGTLLPLSGLSCRIEREVGRGGNAMVYLGWYPDDHNPELHHIVLIKELFPHTLNGRIYRDEEGKICAADARAQAAFDLHKASFEKANLVHLDLLRRQPDGVGGNLNTCEYHGTLYTLLQYDGGRTLEKESMLSLSACARTMIGVLDALNVFHRHGFLHLDVSPDNVLVIGEGRRIRYDMIDYNCVVSVAELADSELDYLSHKEGYSAPELTAEDVEHIGPATDLYAVGAMFFEQLTGQTPNPDDVTTPGFLEGLESPLLADQPETVLDMVRTILLFSLFPLAEERYASADAMAQAFEELLSRIEGRGVTHWALWEAGKKSVQAVIQKNKALAYLKSGALFPLRMQDEEGHATPISEITALQRHVFLSGGGGAGKTTTLLLFALAQKGTYSAQNPAVLYLPLYGWRDENGQYIVNRILEKLKFDAKNAHLADARHALMQVLQASPRANGAPGVCLLLDGLNEAAGDTGPLLREIQALSALDGVRLMLTSRNPLPDTDFARFTLLPLEEAAVCEALGLHGLLIPENPAMLAALQNPLTLAMYIKTAAGEDQSVLFVSPGELIGAYLKSLVKKENESRAENEKCRCEAAVSIVLPAIAEEMKRHAGALNAAQMSAVLARCYKIFSSKWLTDVFPALIGHSADILRGAPTADAFMGQVAHDLLWQKMGLLVRDETGMWRLMHQSLYDTLLPQAAANNRLIRRRNGVKRAIGGALVVLLACAALAGYGWMTRAYDEKLADAVFEDAVSHLGTAIQAINASNAFMEQSQDIELDSNMSAYLTNSMEDVCDSTEELYLYHKEDPQKLAAALSSGTRYKRTRTAFSEDVFSQLYQDSLRMLTFQRGAYLTYVQAYQEKRQNSNWPEIQADYFAAWKAANDAQLRYLNAVYRDGFRAHFDVLRQHDPERYEQTINSGLFTDMIDHAAQEEGKRLDLNNAAKKAEDSVPATVLYWSTPVQTSVNQTEQSIEEQLIDIYMCYLDSLEIQARVRLNAYQAVLNFCANPSWSLFARAEQAMNVAYYQLFLQEAPELLELTEEQIAEISDKEIIQFIDSSMRSWENDRIGLCINLDNQYRDLLYLSFTQEDLDITRDNIVTTKLAMEREFAIDMTPLNALLLWIPDGKSIFQNIAVRYPCLSSYCLPWCETQEEVETQMNTLLDQYENSVNMYSRSLARNTARLYAMEGRTDDATYIFYKDAPLLIPIPQFDEFEDASYFDIDAEGHLILSVNGNVVGNHYVEWPSDRAQFDSYVALLASLDILPVRTSEGDEKQTLFYYGSNENLFALMYEEDGLASAMFHPGSAAFAPLAYCQAVRAQEAQAGN